jgi:5-formyltetrahydrofolate cyclo-ligase
MGRKADIRRTALTQRRMLSQEQVEACSQQIADRFFAEFAPQAGEIVHAFLPILQHREISTWPIIQRIWAEYPAVQVAVSIANAADSSMTHFILTPDTQLQENQWGIPEPTNAVPLPESEISKVLVPLLAYDLNGHRVGYGKGFYDRFMALLPQTCQKLGLALGPPLEHIDDLHAYDLTLDAVITPEKVWNFAKENADKKEAREDDQSRHNEEDSLDDSTGFVPV